MASNNFSKHSSNNSSDHSSDHSNDYSTVHHNCNLRDEYLLLIKSGEKTVEGRLNKKNFKEWKPKDTVEFKSPINSVTCLIKSIKKYNSFKEMLINETLNKCLPNTETIADGVELYYSIPGYKEGESKYGVLAIRVEVIRR